MHLCCHVFLGTPVAPAPSGSHHPWLGPHGTAPAASRCAGSLGAQVREGWVRQQPGAAGARSQDGGGCGEQGAACRAEASRGRSAGTRRQRWGPGHLPGAAGEGAGRLRLWCPAGGATREKPTPLPAHQTPQASDHVITALPPLSTSTVLLKLSAAHGGLFWGVSALGRRSPPLWNPSVSRESRLPPRQSCFACLLWLFLLHTSAPGLTAPLRHRSSPAGVSPTITPSHPLSQPLFS